MTETKEKVIQILEDKIEELEKEKDDLEEKFNDLEWKYNEYERYDFEEILRKSKCFDRINAQVKILKNRLTEFEEDIDKVVEDVEVFSLSQLLKEIETKNENNKRTKK